MKQLVRHIGRQLIHIPDIEPFKIRCQFCNQEPNTIERLLIDRSECNTLRQHVDQQWNELTGSFEDFVDSNIPIHKFNKTNGTEYAKLTEAPQS